MGIVDIDEAAAILRGGGLVAFPTETVYGLGAGVEHEAAVRRIFAVKRRPVGQALTVHLGPSADPNRWAHWTPSAQKLADALWPGPLTLILPRRAGVPDVVTGGRDTVGLRVPSHPTCMALLDTYSGGVAAPSANRHGHISPTTAAHVSADLGDDIDGLVDGGPCPLGVESTVLSLATSLPTILRPGCVPREELETILGGSVAVPSEQGKSYHLQTPFIVLPVEQIESRLRRATGSVAVVSPQRPRPPEGVRLSWMEAPSEAPAYAALLFELLRDLDQQNFSLVVVSEVPKGGLWEAIAHRLRRVSLRRTPVASTAS